MLTVLRFTIGRYVHLGFMMAFKILLPFPTVQVLINYSHYKLLRLGYQGILLIGQPRVPKQPRAVL